MDIRDVSIIYHLALVLLALWVLVSLGWSHPFIFFLALLYLYKVNECYSLRLKKRLQFEEKKNANQRRLLSDSESVRWLNRAVEKIWPICMEQIASQTFLLPIIPWFLEKFKPWTARKAVLQHLYLGRNPPMFTDMRVLSESTDDDHLVLELGMNFLSADDMSAIIAVQLRKRLGFGITANMHVTGMHVEGKVLAGVKFLRHWPFIGRVRVCFVEPPYFQMTVKPIFGHGVDVTEIPGISGWLDKLLDVAFGQTLVEPNMLVIDVEKFASTPEDGWFTVKAKPPVAIVKLEILQGAELKPSDLNGLADPYVKGNLGPYRFQTKIQKKTLAPKWFEEFKIPISSWEAPNLLVLHVFDKDPMFDDMLGNCSVNVNDLKIGQRHDMWLALQNIKMGRIHIALTVIEEESQKSEEDISDDQDTCHTSEMAEDMANVCDKKAKSQIDEKYEVSDEYEPIDVKGQEKTRLWVHRPGSDASETWECRKGRVRLPDTELHHEDIYNKNLSSSEFQQSDSDSSEENTHGKKLLLSIKKGVHKLGSKIFHRSPRNDTPLEQQEEVPSPLHNIHQPFGERETPVKIIVDDNVVTPRPDTDLVKSPHKDDCSEMPKDILSKSAKTIKSASSRKDSKMKEERSAGVEEDCNSRSLFASKDDDMTSNPLLIDRSPISISTLSGEYAAPVDAEGVSARASPKPL